MSIIHCCIYFRPTELFVLTIINSTFLFSNVSSFQPLFHGGDWFFRNQDMKQPNNFLHQCPQSTSSPSSPSSSSSLSIFLLYSTLSQSLEFELKPSITSISPTDWNSCLTNSLNLCNSQEDEHTDYNDEEEDDDDDDGNNNDDNKITPTSTTSSSSPFLEYSWLASLEQSRCASSSTGWMPSHIEIKLNGIICAYVPLYIKNNSNGEFIFDGEWAQYASKMDVPVRYYPKILCGVPFTPVTCSKILMSPGLRYHLLSSSSSSSSPSSSSLSSSSQANVNENNVESNTHDAIREFRSIVANFIKEVATSNNLSSVHLNFISDDEAYDIAGPIPKITDIFQTATTSSNDTYDESNESRRSDDGRNDQNNCNISKSCNKEKEKDTTTMLSSSSSSSPIQDKVKAVMNQFVPQRKPKYNDYFRRTSLQYHWKNCNRNNNNKPYTSFDDYLSCFKSKRRITIKRERKRVFEDQGVRVDAIVGRDILKYPGLVERMFDIYKSTVDKQMFFGKQYLTLDFFERLVESDFVDYLLFMCASYDNGEGGNNGGDADLELDANDVFAGTFNIVKDSVYYGRYWGCLPEYEVKNLHFEVCYWSAIEYCIQNDFIRMEPGAGGGDYKWARGFDPVLIHSAHYITQPALRRAVKEYVQFDSERNIAIAQLLNEQSAVVKDRA